MWISNRNRLPFCFVVTKGCRYQWAGNYPLGFCVNVFVEKQMLVWRGTEVNMIWSIGATIVRCYFCRPQHFCNLILPLFKRQKLVRYLSMLKPSFAISTAVLVFTCCNIWHRDNKVEYQCSLFFFWGIIIAVQGSITLTAPTWIQKSVCRTTLFLLWVSCLAMWLITVYLSQHNGRHCLWGANLFYFHYKVWEINN